VENKYQKYLAKTTYVNKVMHYMLLKFKVFAVIIN